MPDWSKRKRLEAAIAGESSDRLPIALWRHWPGDDQDAEALAAAHLKWQIDYDWDLIKFSPSSSYCLDDWGVQTRWTGNVEGTRDYTGRVIRKPREWSRLKALDPSKGMLATQVRALRLLREALGDEVPILATIFSPLAQARNLAGDELMLSHMRSDTDHFLAGLRTIMESTLRFIDAARDAGIDGIFYAVQHARYALMGRVEYKSFGQPFDERILGEASDLPLNMLHLHGTGDVIFDIIADYDVPLLNWHDRDCGVSLREGLEQFSGAASGGVSRATLHTGTPEDVLAQAIDALAQCDNRRLLLGTGCVIMTNTPGRNLRTLRDFAEKS